MRRKIIAVFVAVTIALSCLNIISYAKESSYSLWSTPTTYKVIQGVNYNTEEYANIKKSANINLEMSKNEYENGQIIITAETKISSYNASISDLVNVEDGAAKISKNNIKIYRQHYIYVEEMMSTSRPFTPDYYPDALIPIENSYNKGENTIAKGKNQAISINVYTNSDTKGGIYKGNLELVIDGVTNNIPVSVTVWDFAIPDEVHTKSAFYTRREWIITGELDNSMEMYKKYYDFLLDYRLSSQELPFEDKYDINAWIKLAKEYTLNPKCSAYGIPYEIIVRTVELKDPTSPIKQKMIADINYNLFYDYINAMYENSTPECNLFKKAHCYFGSSIDEPNYTGAYEEVRYISRNVNELLKSFVDEKGEKSFEIKGIDPQEDLIKLESLVTSNIYEQIDGFVPTYTPLYSCFDSESSRQDYYESMNNDQYASGTVWWYGCWNPKAPYPTYHIDDYSLTARALSWMQYEYGISGNLYWGTADYNVADNFFAKPSNPWTDSSRFIGGTANGDGFLLYPGLDYGVEGPLPSLRLEAIRDGLEDYEYLWLYEQKIKEANEKYGLNLQATDVLKGLFRRLYTGVISTTDSEILSECRSELAKLIELLDTDENMLINIDNVDTTKDMANLSIYHSKDYKITTEQAGVTIKEEPSGNGLKTSINVKLNEEGSNRFVGKVTNGVVSKDINIFISNGIIKIANFDEENHITKLNVSAGIDGLPNSKEHIYLSRVQKDNDYVLKADIKPLNLGSSSYNSFYKPSILIDKTKNFNNISFTDIDTINFDVYYEGKVNEKVDIYVYVKIGNREPDRILAKKIDVNSWQKISISQIYNLALNNLASANQISIAINNSTTETRIIYLDNIYFTTK